MAERNRWIWLFFRLNGRVGRQVFILATLFLVAVTCIPSYHYVMAVPGSVEADTWATVFGFFALLATWNSLALGVKRLHDFDRPGVVAVSLLLPVVSLLAFVVLCILPGTPGPNQYGARADAPA